MFLSWTVFLLMARIFLSHVPFEKKTYRINKTHILKIIKNMKNTKRRFWTILLDFHKPTLSNTMKSKQSCRVSLWFSERRVYKLWVPPNRSNRPQWPSIAALTVSIRIILFICVSPTSLCTSSQRLFLTDLLTSCIYLRVWEQWVLSELVELKDFSKVLSTWLLI